MENPCQREGDDDTEENRRPVAQTVGLYVVQDKMHMDEVYLQTDGSHKAQAVVDPSGQTLQQHVQEQDSSNGQGDVEHALHEQGEAAVTYLLQIDTGTK